MDIAVSYHETVTKLQGLDLPGKGPFDRLDWFALLEDPLFVQAERGGEQLILPLQVGPSGLSSLTNWFSFTWRPLGSSDLLLRAIARDLRRRAYLLDLAPVPEEDGSASRLETAFRKAGWLVFRQQCDENHVLQVEGRSFAEYWAMRPGKMRTTLKRKAKKVDVEILDRFDEVAWADYRAVYAESWKPNEERADILEAFARTEGEAGRIRLGIARAEGRPVAAQFWTVEDGAAYIHKLAHIEAAKPLSAGTTLSAALFERVIDTDRVELVDFGTGSDPYKRDWMELNRPRYRLTCLDWRQLGAWPAIGRALIRHLAPHNRPS
ncbi:GNAT family N-acetyltransferase [Erythrobacter aureus]|uniref:GNAT family N-acetyltransferase n=1 Tax=Erythrobacter aureus TaxID=2182384 RepID=UPI001F43CFCB|nr:GNAT family N-acetyltransferase [Erythrobacter aureus]